ncbi:hypothetical protein E3N88_12831 [Mikania micrantha]|uniref:CCHC-type domain-containing protein n=1 Tax=Mikania micrantha TaxID=192012 RepID=A0A5N6P8G6_9ASTR|nr:hypothetical protein E3N88_12831 [Mikania micrantha]
MVKIVAALLPKFQKLSTAPWIRMILPGLLVASIQEVGNGDSRLLPDVGFDLEEGQIPNFGEQLELDKEIAETINVAEKVGIHLAEQYNKVREEILGEGKRFERRRFNSSQRNKGKFRQEEENESQINFRKNNSDDVERKRNSRNQNKFDFDINKVRCYNCNNFGHYASDCHKSNHGGKQANLVQEEQEDDEPTLLMLQIKESDILKICEDIEEHVRVKEDIIIKDEIHEKG